MAFQQLSGSQDSRGSQGSRRRRHSQTPQSSRHSSHSQDDRKKSDGAFFSESGSGSREKNRPPHSAQKSHASQRARGDGQRRGESNPIAQNFALAIFALIVLAAPLFFGATDRVVQIGLIAAMAIGFLCVPATAPKLSRSAQWLVALALAFFVAKDFLPAAWFGKSEWREMLTRDFSLAIPPTLNPEPGRALDAILMLVIACAWFAWVRTLGGESRKNRLALAWCLFGAATIFAIVCLALGTRGDWLIYGVRYTPGWKGYGPFPNRNHTATLLAMGAMIGCGCAARAGRRKKWLPLAAALISLGVIFVALLESKSRGGLIGFLCGFFVFGILVLAKFRSRTALASGFAVALAVLGLFFAFGSQLLARFGNPSEGTIPTNLRWEIWRDAISIWKNAPLFGHGFGSFAQIFPFFQTVHVEDFAVLHPESSWLKWLIEIGAIPLGICVCAFAIFLFLQVRDAFKNERGFFLRAGGFSALAALLAHSFVDVPSHQPAVVCFALAALAMACPLRGAAASSDAARVAGDVLKLGRAFVLVPIAIAAFWALPFFEKAPAWSAGALERTVAQSIYSPASLTTENLQSTARFFPLNPSVHEALGMRLLLAENRPQAAWREFRIADKLAPFSWQMPAFQAQVSRDFSAGMTLHFWTIAIERSGHRTEEIFDAAFRSTRGLRGAENFWKSYVIDNPKFLPSYAASVGDDENSRWAYERWWETRALTANDFAEFETRQFYICAKKWGTPAQLEVWMQRHPELEARDFIRRARVLHFWKHDEAAWQLLARHVKEPQFPKNPTGVATETLEAKWLANPNDLVNAQAFAQACALRGETERERQVIFQVVASHENAPQWFVEKAAWLHAQKNEYAEAVALIVRE